MDPTDWLRVASDAEATLLTLTRRSASLTTDKDKRQIRQKLPALRQDLEALAAAVDAWQRAPPSRSARGQLDQREIEARARTVDGLRGSLRKLEAAIAPAAGNLMGSAVGGGDSAAARAALFQGYSTSTKPVEDTAETEYLSNQDLLQETKKRTREEDEALGQIEQGLGTLKHIGLQQQKQLTKHEGLLDEMREVMDQTDARLQGNIKRVDRLDEGARGGCLALICIALLIGLIISLVASNWACAILPSTTRRC